MSIDLPCSAIQTALNEDPEFRLNARLWNVGIRLVMGEQQFLMTVEDGEVTHFTGDRDPFDPYHITLGGPAEGWERMLEPVPPPFYQDFWGAFFRHGFEMGGDLPLLYAWYGAVRRMLEVMRETYNRQLQEA